MSLHCGARCGSFFFFVQVSGELVVQRWYLSFFLRISSRKPVELAGAREEMVAIPFEQKDPTTITRRTRMHTAFFPREDSQSRGASPPLFLADIPILIRARFENEIKCTRSQLVSCYSPPLIAQNGMWARWRSLIHRAKPPPCELISEGIKLEKKKKKVGIKLNVASFKKRERKKSAGLISWIWMIR